MQCTGNVLIETRVGHGPDFAGLRHTRSTMATVAIGARACAVIALVLSVGRLSRAMLHARAHGLPPGARLTVAHLRPVAVREMRTSTVGSTADVVQDVDRSMTPLSEFARAVVAEHAVWYARSRATLDAAEKILEAARQRDGRSALVAPCITTIRARTNIFAVQRAWLDAYHVAGDPRPRFLFTIEPPPRIDPVRELPAMAIVD